MRAIALIVVVVVDHDPVEFVDSLLRVGLMIMVELGRRGKPVSSLGILATLH